MAFSFLCSKYVCIYILTISFLFVSVILFPYTLVFSLYVLGRTFRFACMRQCLSRIPFSFRFSLHLSNVGQLLPFVCSRDRVFRTFCRTFCRVFMFALPLRPTFAKRLQGSFNTVLRRFQAFLFVGYIFALLHAFRFVIRAHNSLISLFTPPLHPLPWGITPKPSRAEPRLTFPAILIFSEIFFLQNQSLLAIFLFFSCKTMLIRRL